MSSVKRHSGENVLGRGDDEAVSLSMSSSEIEDVFADMSDEDTIFDPSLLDGCNFDDEQEENVLSTDSLRTDTLKLESFPCRISDIKMLEDPEDAAEKAYRQLPRKAFLPSMHSKDGQDMDLEHNSSVYTLFHELGVEWPCLSFDFLLPNENESDHFSHSSSFSMTIAAGSQADTPSNNKIYLMKIANLKEKTKNRKIDLLQSGMISNDDEDEYSSPSSDEDSDESIKQSGKKEKPVLSFFSIPHKEGGVNRIKTTKIGSADFLATFSDSGHINIWNIAPAVPHLDDPSRRTDFSFIGDDLRKRHKKHSSASPTIKQAYSHRIHKNEGYALSWSHLTQGKLLSGDCAGSIYLNEFVEDGGKWSTNKNPFVASSSSEMMSVEDLQWSPAERNVFSSASTDQFIRIWDLRSPTMMPVAEFRASSSADINVISWNRRFHYLLASGHDDGVFCTWDLRYVKKGTVSPVASFSWHTKPISSIEWMPQDPSVLAVSGSDDQLSMWDLSLECDDASSQDETAVPPQLLFVHQGQTDMKEAHWHQHRAGVVVSTAASGFHIFKTFNI